MISYSRKFCTIVALLLSVALAAVTPALAQGTVPGFDMIGFVQKATVNDSTNPLSGGTITINNHTIIVPANSIVQMPATALGWGEVFSLAPAAQKSLGESGLALADLNRLPGTYEAHVQGNIIGNTGSQQYIAGLIFITQQSLNSGSGFIDKIDYAARQIHVNGTILTINDPLGRFSGGIKKSADERFTIDEDNPTIRTITAYPMCLAAVAPPGIDPLCPETNRVKDTNGVYFTTQTMPDPATVVPGIPDPRVMSPFEVGDFITYAGELQADGSIAAHQIIANLGIFTWPGTNPAYVAIDVLLQGAGAPINQAVGVETTAKVRVEGFSTDPSRTVQAYAMDNLCGTVTDRGWAAIAVDPGPPTGAKLGRFRYRPAGGAFLPPSQYVRVRVNPIFTCQVNGLPCPPNATEFVTKNGLIAGQYYAPNFTYIFPETLTTGGPPASNNFGDFPWLVNGVGTWNNKVSGQLSPWPDTSAPSTTCTVAPPPPPGAPTASANAKPSTVFSGDVITLDGTASQAAPTDGYLWTQVGGLTAAITNANLQTALAVAPPVSVPSTLTFQLTISNTVGRSSAQTTVTVLPRITAPAPPTILGITAASPVGQGFANNRLSVIAADPNNLALTYAWTQTAGPAAKIANPSSATTSFTAPLLALGSAPVTLTFKVTVTNSQLLSTTQTVNSTVVPPADSIAITAAQYTRAKARFQITVTDNVNSANISVTCSIPTINPATGKNYTALAAGQGTYTATFVGIPLPTSVSCWSSANPANIQTAASSQFQIK
jgi:hypothetical protein